AAHGLYAGGYGTIVGNYISHYSGGNRCSSFSGDSPAGYVIVSNSIAHTSGIGSAIFYALGTITATNVIGRAERSPVLFSDGPQISTFINCHLTAGLLGGTVIFSSMARQNGAMVSFINSKLTTLGSTMPALWFGNVIATAYLYNTVINTTSGILITANYSQVTQEFNYYAGYADNSNLLPAIVNVNVVQCNLNGSLIAYNGSSISWTLTQYSNWSGDAYSGYGQSFISVSLDFTSTWTLTGNTALQNISSAVVNLTNIISNGYNITYDSNSTANSWLNGSVMSLIGGGRLMPYSLLEQQPQKQEQQQSSVAASSAVFFQNAQSLTCPNGQLACGTVGCYDPNTQGCSASGSNIQCINSCNGICYSSSQYCYNNTKVCNIEESVCNVKTYTYFQSYPIGLNCYNSSQLTCGNDTLCSPLYACGHNKCYDNATSICFSENSTVCPIGNHLCDGVCYNPQSQYCVGGNHTIFCLSNPSSPSCPTARMNSTTDVTTQPSTTVAPTSSGCCAIQNYTVDADCCRLSTDKCQCFRHSQEETYGSCVNPNVTPVCGDSCPVKGKCQYDSDCCECQCAEIRFTNTDGELSTRKQCIRR
ncbi:unnamed protein product, partial [Adineta ricciae]